MTASVLETWRRIVKEDDWEALKDLLAEDAVIMGIDLETLGIEIIPVDEVFEGN